LTIEVDLKRDVTDQKGLSYSFPSSSPFESGSFVPHAQFLKVTSDPAFHDAFRTHPTPFLFVSKPVLLDAVVGLRKALPSVDRFYYSVKTNSLPEVLTLCKEQGLGCDVASEGELDAALCCGFGADDMLFGNSIKTSAAIARAFAQGVDLFAVDSREEIAKVARHAPGAGVQVRIAASTTKGAAWPSTAKFGADPRAAVALLAYAQSLGLRPAALSINGGSQQTDPAVWAKVIGDLIFAYHAARDRGLECETINLGGGFPVPYSGRDGLLDVCGAIESALAQGFTQATARPRIIAEPGRVISGPAGALVSSVVLDTRRGDDRWVFLDAGLWRGLIEAINDTIRYPIGYTPSQGALEPSILAGMTCDSADVFYRQVRPALPVDLAEGDRLVFLAAGAYSLSYASVDFNGMRPPAVLVSA
jgi:ornithine decarboxylase